MIALYALEWVWPGHSEYGRQEFTQPIPAGKPRVGLDGCLTDWNGAGLVCSRMKL